MTEPEPRSESRSVGRKIVLASIVVLAFLAVLEVGARLLLSGDGRGGAYDLSFATQEGCRISLRPGPLRVALDPFRLYRVLPDQKTERFSIDARGFRGGGEGRAGGAGGTRGAAPSEDRVRVVLVGGSAAFGLGAPGDGATIPALLHEEDGRLEAINAGVPGYLSGQELAYVVMSLVDLEPDWIVAYDGWNDLFDQWYSRRRVGPLFGVTQNLFKVEAQLEENYASSVRLGAGLRRMAGMLLAKSALLRGAGTRLLEPRYRRGTGRPVVEGGPGGGTQANAYLGEIVEHFTRNLEKMRDVCRARGIRFLAVLQPEAGQKPERTPEEEGALARGIGPVRRYREEFPALYREFLERVSRRLSDREIDHLVVSRDPGFLGARERLFLDVVHTTREGNRLVARLVRTRLLRARLDGAESPGDR